MANKTRCEEIQVKITGWHRNIQVGKYDIKELILLFMAAVYPLIVLPDPTPLLFSLSPEWDPNYFLGPRYIILAAVSLTALWIIFKEKIVGYHPAFVPLAFFVVFATVSAFLATYPQIAWIGSPLRLTGVFTFYFCIILFLLAQRSAAVEKILNYMLITAAIVSLTGVMQYFGLNIVPHDPYWDRYISYGTMGHPNFLGGYTSFLLPAAVIRFIQSKKLYWLVIVCIIYTGLMVSLTRGAWIALFVVMAVIAINIWKIAEQRNIYVRIILLFVLITIILSPLRNGTLMNRLISVSDDTGVGVSDSSGTYRVFIWKETSKLFINNWAFGIGPDHIIFEQIIKPDSYPVDKAHNIFLEIAVTMGVFALISYIIFLSFFFRDLKNDKIFVFKTMILVYLIHGLFTMEVVMIMPLFWIVLGLSIASKYTEQKLLSA